MTRKLIAMLLCVMMLASVITVPAFAEDAVSYADYVPGDLDDNMLTAPGTAGESAKFQYFVNNGGDKTSHGHSWAGQYFDVHSKVAYDGTSKIGRNSYMVPGAQIYDNILTTPAQMDTNYVVSFWVKNLTPEYETKVNFAPTVYKRDSISQYTKEYGPDGMILVGEGWQEFKGTMSIGSALSGRESQPLPRFAMGLSPTSLTGTAARFSYNATGTQKMYLAVEKVYNITNELVSGTNIVTIKNPASFKAQIVNQVGLPGYLSQGTFTWKAMNKARTEEILGITVTANGSTATVTVDETVAKGEYDVVAYNATYNMAKGYTITVEEPSEYLDYIPDSANKPANLLTSNTGLYASNTGYTSGDYVQRGLGIDGTYNHRKLIANGTDGEAMSGTTSTEWYRTHGYYFGDNLKTSDGTTAGNIPAGKSLVFSMQVRNMNAQYTPRVTFMLYNFRCDGAGYIYPKEYGSAGMPLTSTEWTDFKGTLVNPADSATPSSSNKTDISFGFHGSTPAGAHAEFNLVDTSAGMYRVYLAEEALYDITNEIAQGSATINSRGEELVLKAQLVNQVGLPGTLSQGTFTWKALDVATRKSEISSITVTPSDDTTTATVTVDSTVAPGEYVIVAKNGDMAKGFVITVVEPNYYLDYEKGEMPANMIKTVSQAGGVSSLAVGFGRTTESRLTYGFTNNYKGYKMTVKDMTAAGPNGAYTNGLYASTNILNGNGFKKTDGTDTGDIAGAKSYVFKMKVKNLNPEDTPYVHAVIYDYDAGGGKQYSKEHGEAGMAVTGSDWVDFKGTIYNKDDTHITQTINGRDVFSFGFPTSGVTTGSSVDFNISDESNGLYRMYLAEEVAYDITNTLISANATLTDDASATFKAQVVNQIELPGYLNQDIEWRVMNKARTEDVEGFVITEGTDGTATVTVDGAAPGTYDVVACSADYKMAKGFEITVEPKEEVTLITVNLDEDGKAILEAAEITNSKRANIMFAIASYNGDKLVDADKVVVAVADGVAALTDAIAITANAGNKIKVFVWDAVDYTPVAFADDVVAEYTR